jgi:polar amino acid transport system substrate-binding protein
LNHRLSVFHLAAALLGALASSVRADTLDDIRSRGALVWGADQEGNAPYIYPDPTDANRVVGFEVDLAEAIAAELGVKSQYSQADWNTLPEFLRSRKIDIVLNGYEWTESRAERMAASRPYYIYELQLLGRDAPNGMTSWNDLRAVLGGCAASIYLHEHWANDVDIIEYDGNTNAMLQVRNAVHDATLLDLPMAIFYRDQPQGHGLRFVGDPVGRGFYVAYARKGDERLIAEIDKAIEKLFRTGRLQQIYTKYGIWNKTQEGLLDAHPGVTAPSDQSAIRNPQSAITQGVIARYGVMLLKAAGITVLLTMIAMPLAMLLGLAVALGRMYGPKLLAAPLAIYVEVLRGTPVMLQLYVIFFILPQLLPFSLSPFVAAVIGLAINYSAYEAEIYRAGLQAIPKGQMEAALALGMTRRTALRRVIVPQAIRIVVPPVTNDFIAMFKDTSVCSVIAVTELTKQYNMLANSTGEILKLAGITAFLYLAMSYPMSLLARYLEKRMSGLVGWTG